MRAIARLIQKVQVASFWRKFLVCIAIGFTVTLLIPSQSNSYPAKDSYQIESSSQPTDYAGSIANNVQVDLRSDCAQVFLKTLSQYMQPTSIQAQWSSGGNIYNFTWSARASKPSDGSIALKTSLRSSALDKAFSSKENTIELAQTNITNQVHPALVNAVKNSGANLGDYSVRGTRNGVPCCGSSSKNATFYGDC